MAKKTASIEINASGNATQQFTELGNSVKSLKEQVKDAQKEAQILSQKFGETSKEALAAQKRLAGLKEELNDFNDRIAALNPEAKFQALGKAVQGVAGGFAAAQGAAALLGSESEDLQKTMVKLQAAMALSQGLNELRGMGDAMKNLKLVAVDALNGIKTAFLANPLFAAGTVIIGSLVAAFAALSFKTNEYTALVEANNKALEENLAIQKEHIATVTRGYDREIAEAKAAGKETIDIERQKLQAQIESANQRLLLLIKVRKAEREAFEEQMAEYGDLRKSVKAALGVDVLEEEEAEFKKNTKKRTDEIKALQEDLKDFQSGLRQLEFKETADNNAKISASNKDRLEQQRKQEEEAAEKRRKQDEAIALAEKEFRDGETQSILEDKQKEIDDLAKLEQIKFNNEIERQAAQDEYLKKKEQERLQFKKDLAEAEIAVATSVVSSIASLGTIFSKNQEKNEAFQKKLAAVQLAIDTAKAISGAVAQAQSLPFPGNIVAIATGVSTVLANIAQAKQLLSSAGGSGSSPQFNIPSGSPSVSLPDFANQPTINSTNVNQTQADTTGSQVNQMVYITQGQLEANDVQTNSLNSKVMIE